MNLGSHHRRPQRTDGTAPAGRAPRPRSGLLRLSVMSLAALSLALMTVQSASASTWTTWFNGDLKPNVWKNSGMPPQAKYNGARVTGYPADLVTVVYVYVPARGVSSGASNVTTTFPYQGGTFQCKFNWGGAGGSTGQGHIKCDLRIQ